jgi:hypothetical protein
MISLPVAGRAAFVDSQLLTALRVTPSALANTCCDIPAIRRALRIRSANAITHPLDPSKRRIMALHRAKNKRHDSGKRRGSNIVCKPPVPLAMSADALIRGSGAVWRASDPVRRAVAKRLHGNRRRGQSAAASDACSLHGLSVPR